MANHITDWRVALSNDLATQFPDAEIERGERTGKSVDKDRIAVFWPGFQEQSGRVVVGETRLIVRYWPKQPKVKNNGSPQDPATLEEAAMDLAAFLQTKLTAYTAQGVWFFRVLSITPDYDPDEWGVEAVLLAMSDNPAVIG